MTSVKHIKETSSQLTHNILFFPENNDLRMALFFCFHLKKSAADSYQRPVEAYDDHALSESTCKRWVQ